MGTWSRVRWVLLLTLGTWAVAVPSASAYIDPGSTSLVFQAIIAFAMAAGLTLKTFWRRIRGFFAPRSSADPPAPHEDAE